MVHCGLTAENTSEMCANGHAKNASPKILIYQCYTMYIFFWNKKPHYKCIRIRKVQIYNINTIYYNIIAFALYSKNF